MPCLPAGGAGKAAGDEYFAPEAKGKTKCRGMEYEEARLALLTRIPPPSSLQRLTCQPLWIRNSGLSRLVFHRHQLDSTFKAGLNQRTLAILSG